MSDAPCTPSTAYGPCAPYATLADVQKCGSCDGMDLTGEAEGEDANPTLVNLLESLTYASRRVFEATGGQWWGCCSITVRPCRPNECGPQAGWPAWASPAMDPLPVHPWESLPAIPFGTVTAANETVFVNLWKCGCAPEGCGCGAVGDRLVLPYGPVRSIESIVIDGEELEREDHWILAADGVVYRIDGETWPTCQDTMKPNGEEGTWSVTYRHGLDAPPELVPLVAAYACELAKSCGGGDCALPPGFRVVNRDGVDFGVVEPAEYRQQGLTGFGPIDDWIMLMRGGHVGIQDAPRAYRPRLPLECM